MPVQSIRHISIGYEPTLRFYCAQDSRSTFVQAFADLDIGSAVNFGAPLRVSWQHSAEFAQFPSGSTTQSSCLLFQPRQYQKRSRYPAAAQISRHFRPVPSGFPLLLPFPGPYLHVKASTRLSDHGLFKAWCSPAHRQQLLHLESSNLRPAGHQGL